ncbi:hypothetical protein TWF718_007591 [Orbilia javanica]|uniref:F-box domain-containing protein n=1 Tax=Orbilia javanica TaxID=47235 RepID=A0AAN8NWE5_9PEZI
MHINDLPNEIHFEILKFLPSIADQISVSLTSKHWQAILARPDFVLSRYNVLPSTNVRIHKFFDDIDGIGRCYSLIGHDPETTRLGCEYSCDTKKITSYYYLFGHYDHDRRGPASDWFKKCDISKCPFLDEPLVLYEPGTSVNSAKGCDHIATMEMEQNKVSRYRRFVARDPDFHSVRPTARHFMGRYLIQMLRVTVWPEMDPGRRRRLRNGKTSSSRPRKPQKKSPRVPIVEAEFVWPGNSPPISLPDVTVREAAQIGVDGLFPRHLSVESGLEVDMTDYVRSIGFAAVTVIPGDFESCHVIPFYTGSIFWVLNGIHYGPYKKVKRTLLDRRWSHEREIVERMEGTHLGN